MLSDKMKRYEAEEGKVFDYKEPRVATIKNLDGTIQEVQEHLNCKYLFLGPNDSIKNYILVDDPKGTK